MGSFNHIGNFSRLPIKCGDRVVVLIGIKTVSADHDINSMAPGMGFSPIFVPIRGNYDDYGGIEIVDKTESVKLLEERLGKSVEEVVSIAERNDSDCGHQVADKTKEILEKLTLLTQCPIDNKTSYFGYIMEHESIFDKLVSMSNYDIKDTYFNLIPSNFLQELGYIPEKIGNDNHENDIILWKHPEYPSLKQCSYIWLESEYRNYSNTVHTITDLCKKIGCKNIPKSLEKSFLDHVFLTDIQNLIEFDKEKEKRLREIDGAETEKLKEKLRLAIFTIDKYKAGKYYFTFQKQYSEFGLFRWGESSVNVNYMCCVFDVIRNEHLQEIYMKDFVDLAAFIMTLRELNLPWGTTSYGDQEISYKKHIDFSETCLNLIQEKYNKYKEDWDEEED